MNDTNIKDLNLSENIYKNIVEGSDSTIFVIDKELKYLLVNKTCAQNLEKSSNDIIGKSIFELFPEIVAEDLSKNIKKVFDTNKNLLVEDKIKIRGYDTYNSASLNPIRNEMGEVVAVAGIVRDITDKKKEEAELIRTKGELQSKLEQLETTNRLMVGRELTMIELKEKNIALDKKISENS